MAASINAVARIWVNAPAVTQGQKFSPGRGNGAGQLAQDQHRDLEFFGQAFQSPRNAGNFFLAVASAAGIGGNDELKIIHDEQ